MAAAASKRRYFFRRSRTAVSSAADGADSADSADGTDGVDGPAARNGGLLAALGRLVRRALTLFALYALVFRCPPPGYSLEQAAPLVDADSHPLLAGSAALAEECACSAAHTLHWHIAYPAVAALRSSKLVRKLHRLYSRHPQYARSYIQPAIDRLADEVLPAVGRYVSQVAAPHSRILVQRVSAAVRRSLQLATAEGSLPVLLYRKHVSPAVQPVAEWYSIVLQPPLDLVSSSIVNHAAPTAARIYRSRIRPFVRDVALPRALDGSRRLYAFISDRAIPASGRAVAAAFVFTRDRIAVPAGAQLSSFVSQQLVPGTAALYRTHLHEHVGPYTPHAVVDPVAAHLQISAAATANLLSSAGSLAHRSTLDACTAVAEWWSHDDDGDGDGDEDGDGDGSDSVGGVSGGSDDDGGDGGSDDANASVAASVDADAGAVVDASATTNVTASVDADMDVNINASVDADAAVNADTNASTDGDVDAAVAVDTSPDGDALAHAATSRTGDSTSDEQILAAGGSGTPPLPPTSVAHSSAATSTRLEATSASSLSATAFAGSETASRHPVATPSHPVATPSHTVAASGHPGTAPTPAAVVAGEQATAPSTPLDALLDASLDASLDTPLHTPLHTPLGDSLDASLDIPRPTPAAVDNPLRRVLLHLDWLVADICLADFDDHDQAADSADSILGDNDDNDNDNDNDSGDNSGEWLASPPAVSSSVGTKITIPRHINLRIRDSAKYQLPLH